MEHRVLFERACEHATRFRDGLLERSPWADGEVGALEAAFGGPTPETGMDGLAALDALVVAAGPGLAAMPGPRFFGWVIGASHPVGVAADMLTSAWGQNAGNYAAAPAASIAEKAVGRWLLDILRLPSGSSVGLVTGATMASFVCLAAARNAVLAHAGWDVEQDGLCGAPPVRVFLGEDAHATIVSGLRYLGFGARARRIPTDAEGRMDAHALAAALGEGSGPAIVIAQAGQIVTGAFDPFAEISAVCRRHGAWLHVDGAFGLWARAAPELFHLTEGVEAADSWSVDGHKWLQTPYDSGFAIVRDAEAHRRAMAIGASYLPPAGAEEHDPSQYAPELSRRARGFPAWAMLKALGRRGVTEMVRLHCMLAAYLAARLDAEPGVRVVNRVVLNQVAVRFGGPDREAADQATLAVVDALRRHNVCLAGGARWKGDWVLRLSVISGPLTVADIDRLVEAIAAAWGEVQAGIRTDRLEELPS